MGGMIALELASQTCAPSSPPEIRSFRVEPDHLSPSQALLIPKHIHTLLLTSTSAGSSYLPDIPSYASFRMFGLLTSGMVKTPEAQMALVAETLFPKDYLDQIVEEEGEWKGKTRREMVEAVSSKSSFLSFKITSLIPSFVLDYD
jgi:hypothetical protein